VAVREERPAWAEPGTAAGRPGIEIQVCHSQCVRPYSGTFV
jgi:hypothetical protein